MIKLNYDALVIELTRRCNLHCAHCLRGDAQDVNISTAVIDRIVSNVDNCRRFAFTGGEPFLALNELEYFIDRIISANVHTELLSVVTNGTIRDQRVIEAFKKFCDSGEDRLVSIVISGDRFHDPLESRATYDFYAELVKDYSRINVSVSHDFSDTTNKRETEETYGFYAAGRAKD